LKTKHTLALQDVISLLRTPVDKYLFIMFRDGKVTVDQLKARLAEKHDGTSYMVLDDLRE